MNTEESKLEKIIYKIVNIIILVLIVLLLSSLIATYRINKSIYGAKNRDVKTQNESFDRINKNLRKVKGILNEKYLGEIKEQDLVDSAIKGYVEGLGDKYTTYYTKDEWQELNEILSGEFYGIGIYMVREKDDNGSIVISEIIEGSPAQKQDLKVGDKILKVDDKEVTAKDFETLPKIIKGKENTKVKLVVLRGEELLEKEVERQKVEVSNVKSKMLEDNIGYIYINTFDDHVDKSFKKEYDNLQKQGMKKLIIDVRFNGGGELEATRKILDMFLEKDKIILISRNNKNREIEIKTKDDDAEKLPIVVLVNEYSASASEILTAALKDNGKAKIIGKTTYGKGVIQTLITPILNGGALKITTEEYLRPNKEKINKVGIKPDIEVENKKEDKEDKQLNKAIEEIKNMN